MASASDDCSDEARRKRIKLSDEGEISSDLSVAEDLSVHVRLNSLGGFQMSEILSDNSNSKSIFLEGRFDKTSHSAVILVEKLPIVKDSIEKLLKNADLALNLKSKSTESNITDYACYPSVNQGDIKATIICPATPKHAEKYKYQPSFLVNETSEVYKSTVLPHLESQKFSLQWVYNILEHKSEEERIVFEDPDPDLGFILLPDLKWDEAEQSSIYLIAICHKKNVKSLRDLNASHLPLLNNIKTKGLETILKKYNIPCNKLRVFLHYQPSYYHLHVHFTSIHKQVAGCQFEKAHLLDDVISNLELHASYYQDITLTYTVKSNDPLFAKLQNASTSSS